MSTKTLPHAAIKHQPEPAEDWPNHPLGESVHVPTEVSPAGETPPLKLASDPAAIDASAKAARLSKLDRWLVKVNAVKQWEGFAPQVNKTKGSMTSYAIDGTELLVYRWADGQGWKLYGALDDIRQAEEFIADAQGDV